MPILKDINKRGEWFIGLRCWDTRGTFSIEIPEDKLVWNISILDV